jgi:flagellar biosynthesis protein FliQ
MQHLVQSKKTLLLGPLVISGMVVVLVVAFFFFDCYR